jgi:hypothetical protein
LGRIEEEGERWKDRGEWKREEERLKEERNQG